MDNTESRPGSPLESRPGEDFDPPGEKGYTNFWRVEIYSKIEIDFTLII